MLAALLCASNTAPIEVPLPVPGRGPKEGRRRPRPLPVDLEPLEQARRLRREDEEVVIL